MNGTLFPLDVDPRLGYRARPYQVDCDRAIVQTLQTHPSCLGVLATGTGKTNVAAGLVRSMDALDGAVICTPLRDLVTQTAARLRSLGIDCGIEMATLRSRSPVTVACYASLLSRKRYEQFMNTAKLLVIDESHLNYTPAAIRMIGYYREAGCKVVGMTASPERTTGDPLTKFYGPVAFNYGYKQALNDGWLVPTKVWMAVLEDLDLSRVRTVGTDFDQKALNELMAKEQLVQSIAALVDQHHDGQPSVVFCQSIRQSEMLREVLYRRGICASIVHSNMDPEERQMHLRDFEVGDSNVILNVGCLTLGWDSPKVRKLFIARPTKSKARYIQMFGRGTRPLPGVVDGWATGQQRKDAIAESGKPFCEVFDITDTTRHNDLQSSIDVYCPDAEPELMKRVRRRTEKTADAAIDIDAIVESEQSALASEKAAREALEVERRKRLIADARFGIYQRDVFADAEKPEKPKNTWYAENCMLFGKFKGQRIRNVDSGYLRWVLDKSNCNNRIHKEAIRRELARRNHLKHSAR